MSHRETLVVPPTPRRWLLLIPFGLAGCSVLPQRPYVERREWPLVVQRPDPLPAPASGPVLLIRDFTAAPPLFERGLALLQPDGSLANDFYNDWIAPPGEAVADALRQWLADSGLFAAVIMPGSRLSANFILEGELLTLIAVPDRHYARAAISLLVLRQRRERVEPVLQRSFAAEAPLQGTSAPAIAGAMRSALAQVLGEIEAALRRLLGYAGE